MRAITMHSKTTTNGPIVQRSWLARALAAAAVVMTFLVAPAWSSAQVTAGAPGRFLDREDIRLYGLGLVVEPARQTVPRDIATIVQTYLAAPGTPTDLPPFAADAEVRATLRGPSFARPVELRVRPNAPFDIPAMTVAGLHSLDNIRLVSGGEVLLYGAPESVEIEVIDRLLVTEVRARPLTADEIRERGIVFDRSNFQAYNFTAAFALADGAQINLNFPVLLPALAGASDVTAPTSGLDQLQTTLQLPTLATIIPDTLRIQTQVPNLSVVGFTLRVPQLQGQNLAVPPIPGVIVIPGDIGFLNQYFSVLLLVSNVAPDGSNLVVSDLTATIVLPAGNDSVVGSPDDPLRMAQTATGESPRVQLVARPGPDGRLGTSDDILTLGPGETNSAEFLVEGRREGSHVVEMELAGTLNGLPVGPVPIRGRAAGAVLVRNPTFTLTFTHPDVVNAGEPYTLDVTVTNTSASPANFVSLNLYPRNILGATLAGEPTQAIDQIPPGDSATVSFELVSMLTGKVTAGTLAGDENVSGRFQLKAGVGELGIPLSPDSLVLPKEAGSLPKPLRDAALGLLGRAYAVATAPPAALPAGVTRFTRKVVYDRAIEVAEAGFRHFLGESLPASAAHLLFEFAGGNYPRLGERSRDAGEREFNERDYRGFDELRRRSFRGDVFASAVGALLSPEWRDLGPVNFHQALAERVSFRPGHVSVLVSGAGPLPFEVVLRDAAGRRLGASGADGRRVKDIPFADLVPLVDESGEATAYLALVAVPEGDYVVELRRQSGAADTPFGVSVVAPRTDGTLRQVAFDGLTADRRPVIGREPDDAIGVSFEVLNDDGPVTTAPADPTVVRAIVDPAPSVLAAVQMPDADVVGCEDAGGVRPGRVIAVLFSEEIDPTEAEDRKTRGQIAKYAVEDNEVVGVALQPGRRIAFVGVREGIGPYVPQALTVSDIGDRRGQRLSAQTLDVDVRVDGAGGVVTGRVVDAEGRRIPYATLRLLYEFSCGQETVVVGIAEKSADADGRYAFNYVNVGPTAKIVAIDPETGEFRAVRFGVQRSGQRLTVDVVMIGRGTFEGRTLSEDGLPLARTSVRITSLTDQSQYGATTDADGRFRVVRIPVGPILVEAVNTTRNAQTFVNEAIPTAGAVIQRDLVLLDVARPGAITIRYGTLRGVVLRADGSTPVGNVPVFAYYQHLSQPGVRCPGASPPPECAVAAARTGGAGSYVFDRVVAGNLRVVAFDEATLQQGTASTVLAPEATVDVNVLLAGGLGTVTGVVLDPAGDPVPGARIGGGLAIVVSDELGRFTLPDVPLGTRQIVAVSDVLQSRGSTTVSLVRAGDTVNATIVLDSLGAIAGRVFGTDGTTPQPGIVVYALARCEGSVCVYGQATTNETGGYRIDGLPMGAYTISAFRRDFSEGNFAPVTLSFFRQVAQGHVVFRGQGRVTGRVVDSNGTTPLKALVGVSGDQLAIAGGRIAVNFQRVDNYRIVETDLANGQFAFNGVWQGAFTLRAAGQFSPDPIAFEGTIPSAGATTDVTLRLQATSVITGTVLTPAGIEPVGPGVSVRYRSAAFKLVCSETFSGESQCQAIPQGIQDAATVTDERGQFLFPLVNAGPFVLTIDDGQGRIAEVRGSVAPAETAAVEARLVGLGGAVIRVFEANRAPDGSPIPVPGARVTLRQIDGARRAFENLIAPSSGPDTGVIRLPAVLAEGQFVVTATDQRNGFVGRADGRVTAEGDEPVVDVFIANATGTVEGRVLRADGLTPVANAEVVIGLGRPVAFLLTNADGEFSEPGIPLGSYTIDVFDAATASRGSAGGRLDLNGQVSSSDITLSALAVVRGRVLEAGNGLPLRGWTVHLAQTLPSGRSAPSLMTMSGLDGSFSFPGATLGAFTVRATRAGVVGSGQGTGLIQRPGQVVDVPVVVAIDRPATATLAGVVRQANGAPAASAALVIDGPSGRRELTAGDDGTFLLPDLRLGRYTVVARAQASADTGATFADLTFNGQTTSVVIVLGGLGRVFGQVVDTAGAPVPFARVELVGQPASGCGPSCLGAADAQGLFEFNAVAAKTFTVTASTPDGLVRGAVGDVLTAGGQRQVAIVLEPSASVTGTVHFANGEPASNITAELAGNGRRLFVATGDDGRFVFPVVSLAGSRNYALELTDPIGPGLARRTFTVNASLDLGVVVLDEADPAVVSTTPTNGATGVARDALVRIEFSEPIDLTTATTTNVRLFSETTEVAGILTPSDGNRVLTFRPLDELADQTRYGLEVSGVRDLLGKPMRAAFTATFTTVDVTPPSKLEITPPPGSTGVTVYTPVRVKYSEPIDPERFAGAPFVVTTAGQPVEGRTDYLFGNTVVVFSPSRPLAENAVYQVSVLPATDFAGQAESAPLLFAFSTTDRTPPVVAALRSLDGDTVIENTVARVVADMADADVAFVDFFVNGQLVGVSRSLPFTLSLQASSQFGRPGDVLQVTGVATDTSGNRGPASAALALGIVADEPPVVATTAPAAGSSFLNGARVNVTVQATDDVGVAEVAYRVRTGQTTIALGTRPLATPAAAATETFGFDMPTGLPPGTTVSIEASARDTAGRVVEATPVAITVQDGVPPTVEITNPASGQIVQPGQDVNVVVSAADAGGIAEIGFASTGVVVASEVRAIAPAQPAVGTSFSVRIPPGALPNERATLTAYAVDAAGNRRDAGATTLVVADNAAPVVTLTTENGRLEMTPGRQVRVVASATDESGITRITLTGTGAFTVSRTASIEPPLATATRTFEISVPDTVVDGQTLRLEARATDLAGNTSAPAVVTLTAVRLADVTLPPSAIVDAGRSLVVELALATPAPAGGLRVTLGTANAAVASVVPFVDLAEGEMVTTFAVTGVSSGTTALSASISGIERASMTVTVDGGIVRGRVVDDTFVPVAGVEVTVTSVGQAQTTTTDGDGEYEARGLLGPGVAVRVLDIESGRLGYATGTMNRVNGFVDLPDVILIEAGSFVGTVVAADGTTPAGPGVQVDLYRSLNGNRGDFVATTFTEADSSFAFRLISVGEYQIEARDNTTGERGRITATIVQTGAEVQVAVPYLGRATVRVTVRNADGTAIVQNATVTLASTSIFGSAPARMANSGQSGVVSFDNVHVGTFSASATDPVSQTSGLASGVVTAHGETVDVEVRLAAVGTIAGVVLRADGSRVGPNVPVSLQFTSRSTITDANGEFLFEYVPLGTYTVRASEAATRGQGSATATLTTTVRLANATVQFLPQGVLRVTVVDANGLAVEGAAVSASVSTAGGATDQLSGTTGAGGLIVLSNLLSGTVNVTAARSGLTGTAGTTLPAGGDVAVTVQLQPVAAIAGQVFLPNGESPATAGTVHVRYRFSTGVLRTLALSEANGGTFLAEGLPLAAYDLFAYDAQGRLRAVLRNVQLTENGQVAGVSMTFVGLGTVSGLVTNPNGSSASGLTVTVQALAPEVGRSFSAVTNAGGVYTVSGVPVGSVLATTGNPSLELLGEATGVLAGDGMTLTLNIALQSSAVALPLSTPLRDAYAQDFSLRRDGSLLGGSYYSVFGDGAMLLDIVRDGAVERFAGSTIGQYEDGRREVSVRQDNVRGLNVTRKLFVPSTGYFGRYLEILSNPGADPVTVDVRVTANVRAAWPTSVAVQGTSSGDAIFAAGDRWVVVDDGVDADPYYQTTQPPVAFVVDGDGAGVAVGEAGIAAGASGTGIVTYEWRQVAVPAFGRVALMHFVSMQTSRAAAIATGERLAQLPPEAMVGLSPVEVQEIANFVVPPDLLGAVEPLPPLDGRVTVSVVEGDGTTPVPGSTPLRFRSSVPVFSREFPAWASNGTGAVQPGTGIPVPLAPLAITATHPQSGVVAGPVTVALSTTTPVASTTMAFTGTAMVEVRLRRLDGSIVPGGQLTSAFATLEKDGYSRSSNADSLGVARFFGVPVGDGLVAMRAAANHAQGTSILVTGLTATLVAGQLNSTEITFTGGTVTGRVLLSSGEPAAGRALRIADSTSSFPLFQRNTTTDANGVFLTTDVPAGTYYLRITHPSGAQYNVPQAISVGAGQTVVADQVLPAYGSIRVTVRRTNGELVSGTAYLRNAAGTQLASFSIPTTGTTAGQVTFTQVVSGNYSIEVRPLNQVTLSVTYGATVSIDGQVVDVAATAPPFGSVTGTIRTPGGQLMTNWCGAQLLRDGILFATACTDSQGRYTINGLPSGAPLRLNVGYYYYYDSRVIRSFDAGPIAADGETVTLDGIRPAAATVRVTAQDQAGVPVRVRIEITDLWRNWTYIGETSATTGQLDITNVPEGPYSLRARDASTFAELTTVTGTIVSENDNAVVSQTVVVLGRLTGTVTGRVLDVRGTGVPASEALVRILTPEGVVLSSNVTVGSDGSYSAPGISVVGGAFKVEARWRRDETRLVEAAGTFTASGQTVDVPVVLPIVYGRLEGFVRFSNGEPLQSYIEVYGGPPSYPSLAWGQTEVDGSFSFTPRWLPYPSVEVTAWNWETEWADTREATFVDDVARVEFIVEGRLVSVSGRVVAADGTTPVGSADVELTDDASGTTRWRWSQWNDGTFDFGPTLVTGDSITLRATSWRLDYIEAIEQVSLAPAETSRHVEILLPISVLKGAVYLDDTRTTRASDGVSVFATHSSEGWTQSGEFLAESGEYFFLGLPPATYSIVVQTNSGLTATAHEVLIEADQLVVEEDVVLPPSNDLLLTVTAGGVPVADARVLVAVSNAEGASVEFWEFANENGQFLFPLLPLGPVFVQAADYGQGRYASAWVNLPTRDEASPLSVALDFQTNLGTLSGRVYDAAGNPTSASVTVQASNGHGPLGGFYTTVSTTSVGGVPGYFTVTNVPAGGVAVTATNNSLVQTGSTVTTVTASTTSSVEVRMQTGRWLSTDLEVGDGFYYGVGSTYAEVRSSAYYDDQVSLRSPVSTALRLRVDDDVPCCTSIMAHDPLVETGRGFVVGPMRTGRGLFMTRKIFVAGGTDAPGQRFLRYLDVVRNPFDTDVEVTVTLASYPSVFAWSTLYEAPDFQWFAGIPTNTLTVGLGIVNFDGSGLLPFQATFYEQRFRVVIPAGGSVGFLRFLELGPRVAGAADVLRDRILDLRDLNYDALAGLSEAERRSIVNFRVP